MNAFFKIFIGIMCNNKKGCTKSYTCILFILFYSHAAAQFPVQIIPQLVSPYTLQLSDYYTGSVPKLYVTLTNRDLQQPTVKVKMRVSISGQSAQIRTNDNAFFPTITLDAGIPLRLSLNDLEPYFNPNNLDFSGMTKAQYLQQGKLPEGFYTFCFEAIEINTNKIVSRKECSMAWISLCDPPLLNSPSNGVPITPQDPVNIVFNWTPRHLNSPNGAFNTDYEFQLVELYGNADPIAAFQSTRTYFYQTTTASTTLLYGPSKPQLRRNAKYAWRIKAKARNLADDRDDFRNSGYSDVYTFIFEDYNCLPAANITASLAYNVVNINWNSQDYNVQYQLKYRKVPDQTWTDMVISTNTGISLTGLKNGATYEYMVRRQCKDYSSVFSTIQTMIIPQPPAEVRMGKIYGAYKSSDVEKPDLNNTTLNVNNLTSESLSNITYTAAPTTKSPLENVDVKLYKANTTTGLGEGTMISQTKTDKDGNYSFTIDVSYMNTSGGFYIKASHPSGVFDDYRVNMANTGNGQYTQYKFDLTANRENNLSIKTFELSPKIFCSNCNASDTFSVDILLDKSSWDKSYAFIKNIDNTVNASKIVNYKGETYVIIATLNKGINYRKLLQNLASANNYLIRVNKNNSESTYTELRKVNIYGILSSCFKYTIINKLEGIVTSYNIPKGQVIVKASINSSDIINTSSGAGSSPQSYTTTTNEQGYYLFTDIPKLNPNAKINLSFIDRSIRSNEYLDSLLTSNNDIYQKNIDLVNDLYTFTGRLLDQDNIPVANAVVKNDETSQKIKTSAEGFFVFQTNYVASKTFTFSSEGYDPIQIPLSQFQLKKLGTANSHAAEWNSLMQNTTAVVSYLTEKALPKITADILGIGNGDLVNIYSTYINESQQTLTGIGDVGILKIRNTFGLIKISAFLNGQQIRAKLKFNKINPVTQAPEKTIEDDLKNNASWNYFSVDGDYNYSIKPFDNDAPFEEFFGNFTLAKRALTDTCLNIKIQLKAGAKLTGIITDSITKDALDSAFISFDGLPYTTMTNKQGEYTLFLPINTDLKITVKHNGHNRKDSVINLKQPMVTLNYRLQKIDPAFSQILTISGFTVDIEKQLAGSAVNTYIVTGKLILKSNDVFSTVYDNEKLSFKNIIVKIVDNSGNAMPLGDIAFEEAVLQTKAFGYAPTEITGLQQIQLRALPSTPGDYTKGVIGGSQLTFRPGSIVRGTKIPVNLNDATFIDADVVRTGGNNFSYVYVSPGVNLMALSSIKTYRLEFVNDGFTATTDNNFTEAKIGKLASLFIKKTNASINTNGISLNGYFQIPNLRGSQVEGDGKITITRFIIDKTLAVSELSFDISDSKPVFLPLQKLTARLNNLILSDIGTSNVKVNFGGEIWLKKKARTSTDKDGTMTIQNLEIETKGSGVALKGTLGLPTTGLTIKSLQFSTIQNVSINYINDGYSLETSGKLGFAGLGLMNNKMFKSVFQKPLNIQQFKINSKDWSVFIEAEKDFTIDFKVMKVNISRLLVNVGYDISMNDMNSCLMSSTGKLPTHTAGSDVEAFDENDSRTSWAIGITGGVDFSMIPQASAGASVSMVVGMANNSFDARINEIDLRISNPAFTLTSKVGLMFSDTTQGFSAVATMKTLARDMAASFKYYYYPQTNKFLLAASLSAQVEIETGPIIWHRIGGGFSLNTQTNVYDVYLNGDLGPLGTPETTFNYHVTRLGLLFGATSCSGAMAYVPVVSFEGTTKMLQKDMGTTAATIDFCSRILIVNFTKKISLIPGLADVTGTGNIYAMPGDITQGQPGSFFMSFDTKLNVMADIIKGDAFVALGYNYTHNATTAPQAIKTAWALIDAAAKGNNGTTFNGVFVDVSSAFPSSNNYFGTNLGPFDVGLSYYLGATAQAKMYYNYTTETMSASATVNGGFSVTAYLNTGVHNFRLSGGAALNAALNLKYTNNNWYADGTANTNFYLESGSAGCNSLNLSFHSCACSNLHVPCCGNPFRGCFYDWSCTESVCLQCPDYSYKICFAMKADFNYGPGVRSLNIHL